MHTYTKTDNGEFVIIFPLPQGGNKTIRICPDENIAINLVNILNGGNFSAETLRGLLNE